MHINFNTNISCPNYILVHYQLQTQTGGWSFIYILTNTNFDNTAIQMLQVSVRKFFIKKVCNTYSLTPCIERDSHDKIKFNVCPNHELDLVFSDYVLPGPICSSLMLFAGRFELISCPIFGDYRHNSRKSPLVVHLDYNGQQWCS